MEKMLVSPRRVATFESLRRDDLRVALWLALAVASTLNENGLRIANAQVPMQSLTFQPTTAEILNPERGFLRYTTLTSPGNYAQIRAQGQTLVWGRVVASGFRNQPLSQAFLNSIQNGLSVARTNGLKVKFRLAYNDGFQEPDAPKAVILNHIQQLKPLWEQNKDVIFNFDAGFIGSWGEWHNSTNGLDNPVDRSEILHALLDAVPVERTVGVRYPHFKREIFGGSQQSDAAVITAANAFDGSDLSRVGHLNDCFLSSSNDVGTYVNPGALWPLSRELDYIGGESRYSIHGGETCAPHARNNSLAAIAEMETLHTDYLNLDYHPAVIQKWKDDGKFDEIQRRLGYRFELRTASVPTEVRPGGLIPFEFTIANVGFGELFNARKVEVTLRNNVSGEQQTASLEVDPRFWSGGTTHNVATHLTVPESLDEGTYSLGLWMPDVEASLRNDVRYSIQFANLGVWDPATGINWLTRSLVVSQAAPGPLYEDLTQFAEVTDLSELQLTGDFDDDGDADGTDALMWQQGESPHALSASDLEAWRENFGSATDFPFVNPPGAAALTLQRQLGGRVAVDAMAGVPEPANLLLLLFAVAGAPFARRRGIAWRVSNTHWQMRRIDKHPL